MTRVIKIDGAPGTGKTYTLKEQLQRHKADGLPLGGFYWLTFTNSGREDVEPEIADVYPGEEPDEAHDRARTFHSLSLSLMLRQGYIDLGDPGEEGEDRIISPDDRRDADDGGSVQFYEEFCESHGLAFDPADMQTEKLLSGEKATEKTGNQLFAVNDYLTQCCYPPERWRDAPVNIRTTGDTVIRLLDEWDRFKRDHTPRLWEHGDYVAEAFEHGLTPAVDVLLVDEFQDLAPVEYRLFKLWRDRGSIDVAYIAGDPEQSIYSFRGGKSLYFEETDIDKRITLKESYRCPAEVAAVATAILDSHPDTDPRGFLGLDAGGASRWRSYRGSLELAREVVDTAERYPDADPSVMLLTRTRRQQRSVIADLRDAGVPFDLLGRRSSVWVGSMARMLQFLNNWKGGASGFVDRNAASVVTKLPVDDVGKVTKRQLGDIIDRESVAPYLEGYDGAAEIVDALQISGKKRRYLKNAVDDPAELGPRAVRVGTIHAAKGLEAPAVYLFTDTSKKARRRYHRHPTHAAEEHRVYYVGATRASAELNLVRGYFSDLTAPPLKRVEVSGVPTP